MITDLHLKRSESRLRKSVVDEGYCAWWIAGSDPAQWLSVISFMSLPQGDLSLYPLMNEMGHIKGVFVRSVSAATHPPCSAVPFREFASKLWVPWDAELVPSVSDEENIQLMDELVFFADGKSSYLSHSDALGVFDLLDLPRSTHQVWNHAVPTEVRRPKVMSVALIHPVQLDDVMEKAGEGIGEKSPKELLSKTDKMFDAIKGGMGKGIVTVPGKFLIGGALITVGGLGAIGSFLNRFGTGSQMQHGGDYIAKANLLDQFADWLKRKQVDIAGSQRRELDRLKQLLKDDPERGLQFAIPLGGDAGRGVAASDAFLGRQKVDFNLSGLSSSGRIDSWSMEPDVFSELQKAYREAANREVSLGRHRKAAYIYGNLLSDMPAAAEVLRQGGYYSEAAQIHLKKLGNKRKAAECYVEAGMIQDAVALYEEVQDGMAIALLYRKLGNEDQAKAAFMKEVECLMAIGQTIKAAELCRKYLNDLARGLELLQSAWPSANDAEAVLTKELEWYAELKLHKKAIVRVRELISKVSLAHADQLAFVFADIGDHYPDPEVVDELKDAARLAIACDMKNGGSRLSVSASHKLGKVDKIFRRDVQRYYSTKKKEIPLLPCPVAKRGGERADVSRLEFVKSVKLPDVDGHKVCAVECKRGYVLGVGRLNHLSICRGLWTGGYQTLEWNKNDLLNPKMIGVYETNDQMHLVVDIHPSRLDSQSITGAPSRGEKNISVQFSNAEYDDVVAATYDDNGNLMELRIVNHEMVLSSKNLGGAVKTRHLDSVSHLLEATTMRDQLPAMKMIYAHGDLYLITGVSLVRVTTDDVQVATFPWEVNDMTVSPAYGRPRIFVYSSSGSAMVWLAKEMHVVILDEEAVLGATFTADGMLLCRHNEAISARTARSEETLKYPKTLSLPKELKNGRGILHSELMSTGERGEVAVFVENEVVICRLR